MEIIIIFNGSGTWDQFYWLVLGWSLLRDVDRKFSHLKDFWRLGNPIAKRYIYLLFKKKNFIP